MSDFHTVKSGLTALSKSEILEIKKTCELLLERDGEIPTEGLELFEVIQLTLSRSGLVIPNIYLLRRNKKEVFTALCDTGNRLFHWMEGLRIIKRVDKRLMLHILAEMVKDEVDNAKISLSLTIMVRFFNNAPSYFNNAFPGYAESGMVQFLLDSRKVKK